MTRSTLSVRCVAGPLSPSTTEVHEGHGCSGERKQGRLAHRGTGSLVFGPPREHHVVDDQGVLTGVNNSENLTILPSAADSKTQLPRRARRGQRPALGGDLLVQPRSSSSAFSSWLRARRYSLDSPGNVMFGSRSVRATWPCRVACPWAPWCFILSIPASFPILRFFTTPRGEREDHVVGVGGAALIIVDDLPNHSADTQPVAHRGRGSWPGQLRFTLDCLPDCRQPRRGCWKVGVARI